MVIELGVLADTALFPVCGQTRVRGFSGSRKIPGSDSRRSAILSHGSKSSEGGRSGVGRHRNMKQTGFPVDHFPVSPVLARRGEWHLEGFPPPERPDSEVQGKGVESQETASPRASHPSSTYLGSLTPSSQGPQSQIHNNSSLPFTTFTQTNNPRPSPFSSHLRSLALFHQLGPWGHTYASPQFHHCPAGPDHASIRARIRQPLASLHKLRAPGGQTQTPARRRLVNEPLKAWRGRPASKTTAFQNK